ncbi:MAG: hypothetical protein II393_02130 [Cytophagales bacterium]|nr:hypothetical protein [Cytophagales bacterium]
MKKGLIVATLIISTMTFGIIKPKAYVTLEDKNGNRINPNAYGIIDPYQNWDMSAGSYWSIRDPWLVTPSQFWYAGGVHGTNISVVADYYIGMKQEPYSDATVTNYLYSTQNTIKAANLRCGIGDYKQGYDATYAPVVTNFDASYVQVDHVTGSQYLYHIQFNYQQQIREINVNSTNMSCWFERQPSNGLFAQTYWATSADTLRFYSQNVNISYSVSMDPNTAILNNITNQNATMIDQNNTIINQQTQINNTIDQDHTYNNNPSETIDGKQDMDDLKDAEQGLMEDLDFSGVEDIDITINAEASSFIWQIVEQLRQMNGAIVLLITSILGLGIIKMILNR